MQQQELKKRKKERKKIQLTFAIVRLLALQQ